MTAPLPLADVSAIEIGIPAGESGLTSDQAAALLAEHGPNNLVPSAVRVPALVWVIRVAKDPMVLLLLIATAVYLATGQVSDAIVTALAVVPIAGVSAVLEARSERALDKLRALTAATARALRDGAVTVLPAAELVPGDLVLLREGDVIPADCRLVDSSEAIADESSLTGESEPVVKEAGRDVRLLAGTTLLAGRAAAVVTATGPATEYGRVGKLLASVRQPPTPLERTVRRLTMWLLAVAGVFCLLVAGVELLEGHGWAAAMIAGVSLGIAAVPEEFPMVYALYLAVGAWRLARHEALVRRLAAVETLGSASVICTDKTGTVTAGRMSVAALRPLGGAGSDLLRAALLACERNPFDPVDVAIVDAARAAGIGSDGEELVRDYGFDRRLRYMSHLWRGPRGLTIAAKGALEGLLVRTRAGPVMRAAAEAANSELARGGMRVIAVAEGSSAALGEARHDDEKSLELLGLIGFADPLRPGIREAVTECRTAGIRVVMVTGDHALTASSVAGAAGIDNPSRIATGDQLEAATTSQRERLIASCNVFARIRPEQKHWLVEALKKGGQVVAMTGDGINDAPALRQADIGVAMGRRGTEVAREAATMVLLDDNFATIVTAVRDGRRIFRNLGKAFAYLIAFHAPLLLGALVVPILGAPLLLLPVHLVLLELLVHPAVSLVFEAEAAPPDLMHRPPRGPRALLIDRRVAIFAALQGVLLFGVVLAVYLSALRLGAGTPAARGTALVTMLTGQVSLLLIERARPRHVWTALTDLDRTTAGVVAGALCGILAIGALGPLAIALHLQPLSLQQWGVALAAGLAGTLWADLVKRPSAVRSRGGRPGTRGSAAREG